MMLSSRRDGEKRIFPRTGCDDWLVGLLMTTGSVAV